ncbi:hypothetical protein [Agromyces sp. Marseille-Q5079]|uniref:hypothetical protein n=1 Tax=Agromyces sp. Marseille-Q5079 TaxID=3439059 RepID=UPI003D9CBB89
MARTVASPPEGKTGNAYTRFFERVDRALSPAFGGATSVDDHPEDATPIADRLCPLCGHAMGEHVIDHSTPNSMLECPTDERLPERPIDVPLNEFGMTAPERADQRGQTRGT